MALIGASFGCQDDSSPSEASPSAGLSSCPQNWERPFLVDEVDYPFTSRCVELAHGLVHYFDESPEGEPRGTVLAVHGNPTWSFLYRKVATALLERGFRVIALDLYGFGMSGKPRQAEFDYRASSHAETVQSFVSALDLTDLLLVVQDWGGPVGLSMAVQQPERIRGLVLINTWSWALERIAAQTTSVMHTVHDWGVENIVNAAYYDATHQTAIRAGDGLGRRNDPNGGETFARIRNAYRGPFFALDETEEPLGPEVVRPVNIFAQALITDAIFLRKLDAAMPALHNKPVYFMFGDDTAFGPLKCDVGPFHSYSFEVPRVTWSDDRPLCPPALTCETEQPEPLSHNCLDRNGEPYWPVLDRYLTRWPTEQVVGVWADPSAGHWLQETHPDDIVGAIIAVRDHAMN